MYTRLEIIEIVKKLKGMIIPWKRAELKEINISDEFYTKGWNDAIKESRNNYKKYVEPWLELLEKNNN